MRLVLFVLVVSWLVVGRDPRFGEPKKTEKLKREFLAKLQKKRRHQKLFAPAKSSVVVSRNYTGIAQRGVLVFRKDVPRLHPTFSLTFNVYLTPQPNNERYRMLFLLQKAFGCLSNGRKLKLVWNNERGDAMELFVDIPVNMIENWVQLGFDFRLIDRTVDVYINQRKVFFILDFSTKDFDLLYMGASPHFPEEDCNCVFQNFVLYNHLIAQNTLNLNEKVIDFKFDGNHTEMGMNLTKKGNELLKMENLDGLELLHEAKRMGNVAAMRRLGEINFVGSLIEPHFESAHNYFVNCSLLKDSLCLYYAAVFESYGLTGRGRNEELALLYHSLAIALNGEIQSQFSLSHKYYYGIEVKKNHFISNYYYKNAADYAFRLWQQRGLKDTQYYSLERYYEQLMDGQRAKHENDEMIEIEKYKAEVGNDAFSAEWVGDSFYHGKRSVKVNYDIAQKYYKIAAQRNSTTAKVHLARMHFMKQKLLDSNKTFLKLLNEASDANSSDATNLLGCIAKTESEALYLFQKAALTMDTPFLPVATTNAGVMHNLAASFENNFTAAYMFYTKAAAQGDVPAYYWLAHLFSEGKGVNQSYSLSSLYFQKATQYHIRAHYIQKGWICFLEGNYDCAFAQYLICGDLGYPNCFLDLIYILEKFKDFSFALSYDIKPLYKQVLELSLNLQSRKAVSKIGVKLGHYYFEQDDHDNAFKHYALSAFTNSTEGVYNVAFCYEYGIGVERNITYAIQLYKTLLFGRNWMIDLIAILSILRAAIAQYSGFLYN